MTNCDFLTSINRENSMKRIVTVQECDGQGLESLLGKNVVLFCMCYIYHGTLVGVNTTDVILESAGIVYETGPLKAKGFKDIQELAPKEWRVRTSSIESYGEWEK